MLRLRTLFAVLALSSLPAMAAPVITVAPNSVVFNYTALGAVPAPQSVAVTSDTATAITGFSTNYIAGGNPGWLSVFPPGPQNTPGTLALSVAPIGIGPGTYIAQVNVTAAAFDPASVLTITVFLIVNGATGGVPSQTITPTPASLNFSWTAGTALPVAQTLSVKVSDDAAFAVSRTTDTGAQWLNVTPVNSTSPGTVTVSVDPSNLAGGTYNGVITLTAPFSVVQVPVTLTVGGFAMSANPAAVTMSVPQNYGVSAPVAIQVTAPTPLSFTTFTTSDGNWLQVDAPSGTTPGTLNIRANTSGLAQGTYAGTLNIRSGNVVSLDVPVSLVVGPPAPMSLSPASLSFAYTIGDPAPAVQTTRVNSLSANPQSFTMATTTTDGGTWLRASANQTTTPSVITISVVPGTLAAGTYTGLVSLTPSTTGSSPQPIQVTMTVKAPPPPVIQSINSSASYGALAVAPGQYVTLFGSAIGPKDLVIAPGGTAPRTLGNTTVTFGGLQAPILYASSTQTSVQVPYGVVVGQQTPVQVTYNGLTSVVKPINVIPAYAGLFTSNSSGSGQAAALNADLSLNSAANPAARGTTLVLYGTGEGTTLPASVEGTVTPSIAPIPSTQLPVLVTIGGVVGAVEYKGETPGLLSGLFQINVRVPDTAPVGSAVPVVVNINGVPSQNNVTVAIK